MARIPEVTLDDRTFQDLVNEARLRLSQRCPEWSETLCSDHSGHRWESRRRASFTRSWKVRSSSVTSGIRAMGYSGSDGMR